MQTMTITLPIYRFDELTPKAADRAMEQIESLYREWSASDSGLEWSYAYGVDDFQLLSWGYREPTLFRGTIRRDRYATDGSIPLPEGIDRIEFVPSRYVSWRFTTSDGDQGDSDGEPIRDGYGIDREELVNESTYDAALVAAGDFAAAITSALEDWVYNDAYPPTDYYADYSESNGLRFDVHGTLALQEMAPALPGESPAYALFIAGSGAVVAVD